MLKSLDLSKNNTFYYDLERRTIARFPSKSNLLITGSDNSLYFGMTSNKEVVSMFLSLFDKKKIDEINGMSFKMKCGYDTVDVVLNINHEGQIQVKVCKNGTMGRLTSEYAFNEMKEIDFTQMLIVVDFAKEEIRFKNPEEMTL